MKTYYVDGHFLPSDKAMIPVNDLAVLRGYGVCDIMRTYSGVPFFIDDHIDRLINSAEKIGIQLPWSPDDIRQILFETLEKNKPIDEINLRIVITGGSSSDFTTPDGLPRLIILISDIPKLPESWYQKGVKVITACLERSVPDAKTLSYGPATMLMKKAKQADAIEVLYVNQKGQVMEGTTSNLFAFFSDTLVTPGHGILKGITRKAVLDLSKELFSVKEHHLPLSDLLNAQEVFISGTNKGIVPVVKIDNHTIGKGVPGKQTIKLMKKLSEHARQFSQSKGKSASGRH